MLQAGNFFSTVPHNLLPLFEGTTFVWETLPCIAHFIQKQSKLGTIHSPLQEGVFLANPGLVYIGKNVVIEPGVFIKGPAWIEDDCEIRQGAYLRENVILGKKVVVGHCSEIKNSILFPEAHAAHFNYVGDSILGSRSNLGAGVICSNVRLDKETIYVHFEGKKLSTGLRKMGAIVGDDVQIGCNAVVQPGTLIEKFVFCHPCATIKGFITKEQC
ncbi:MAG: UDP-N-acetylglucosamine diphosphorylase [Chlamydiae bacterium]|nr:UDP-N-acetylglucosamine diphosphorylase [Chlamydiota bacterium]